MHHSQLHLNVEGPASEAVHALFDKCKQSDEPPRKRNRSEPNPTNKGLEREVRSKTYLTAAIVDIDLVFAAGHAEDIFADLSSGRERECISVILKTFKQKGESEYHCCITSLSGVVLVDAYVILETDVRTLNVLKRAAGLSISTRNIDARAATFMYPISSTGLGPSFRVSVRISLRDSNNLGDGSSGQRDLLDLCFDTPQTQKRETCFPRDFYESVFVPDRTVFSADIKIPLLKCQLYDFQKRAVLWLLWREGFDQAQMKINPAEHDQTRKVLSHGFIRAIDADGKNCFVSHFLGLITTDEALAQNSYSNLKGGILAEEMGLGKTIEVIALICLHQQIQTIPCTNDPPATIQNTPATLIITPRSILQQWENELQTVAPGLKVMVYAGIHQYRNKITHEELMAKFLAHDVVLTTYDALSAEIHYASGPSRVLRHEKKYQRKLSPVTQIVWWRVVLDEAQLLENGLNNAAKMAQLIPRQNAWAVSGTPIRKNAKDLLGLLTFLRYQPYYQSPKLWDSLIMHHQDIFKQIFNTIALRQTKEQIKHEIEFPPQRRIVVEIPFTRIEQQHYSNIYQEMCDDCGLDQHGSPIVGTPEFTYSVTVEKMRSWLSRLRQTCLHPEVGRRNRRALGNSKGPLRTVKEVLEVMIAQNDTAIRNEERACLLSQIRRGQLLEHAGRSEEALRIWSSALKQSIIAVEECRQTLKTSTDGHEDTEVRPVESEPRSANHLGSHRHRLRSALEVEHMCTFFVANAYFQIRTDPAAVAPDLVSSHLEKLEEDTYEKAKELRKEILSETHRKAQNLMATLDEKLRNKSFVGIPNIELSNECAGSELHTIVTKGFYAVKVLNDQAKQLDEWREKMVELLLLPLVDSEDAELKGNEYETSTQQQDEVYVYMSFLRSFVADRHYMLTGQRNNRVDHEMKVALEMASEGKGHSPALSTNMFLARENINLLANASSLRSITTELRDLNAGLRIQGEKGNTRAIAELVVTTNVLQQIQRISAEQTKVIKNLDQELELFRDTMNSRLEYYRQLQQISDSVAPYEKDLDNEALTNTLVEMLATEENLHTRVSALTATGRYLVHLRDEAAIPDSPRSCIICQLPFDTGVMTSCGHSYCAECLRLWWRAHRSCPTCKRRLNRTDFHQITCKPQDLILENDTHVRGQNEQVVADTGSIPSASIYSKIHDMTFDQIKKIDIDGSFGTKIDTLARHILWIRENDPGAKSIVFSQFRDFLDVLAKAFTRFKIGFTGIDKREGVQDFKQDPSLECFFLHAKAHSSGLNLTVATHVILCEPLINTAIELQAIARVHRIGQHQSTTVWMFLVEGTVEKAIYDISVDRRMSHLGRPQLPRMDDLDRSHFETEIEVANTMELQEAALSKLLTRDSRGGEVVANNDLWDCLFSRGSQKPMQMSL